MIGEVVLFKLSNGMQRPAMIVAEEFSTEECRPKLVLYVALHPQDKRERRTVVQLGDGIRALFAEENNTSGLAVDVPHGDEPGTWQYRE